MKANILIGLVLIVIVLCLSYYAYGQTADQTTTPKFEGGPANVRVIDIPTPFPCPKESKKGDGSGWIEFNVPNGALLTGNTGTITTSTIGLPASAVWTPIDMVDEIEVVTSAKLEGDNLVVYKYSTSSSSNHVAWSYLTEPPQAAYKPSKRIWKEIYGACDGKIKLLKTVEAIITPALEEKIEWPKEKE